MRWRAILAVGAVALAGWTAAGFWREPAVTQPVQFPHKTHIELNLECTTCHEGAEKDVSAGRPATTFCLSCHAGGDGSPELRKVQAYERGGEIPWRRVWRLPPHVYFSHRVHVAVARVKCQTCHGPMETLDRPPARPLRKIAMADCIGCHEHQRGAPATPEATRLAKTASTDCNNCHR